MKAQTADNLRCLAGAVFAFAALVVVFAAQPASLSSIPMWVQIIGMVLLLFLILHVFNFRPAGTHPPAAPDRVTFDDTLVTRTLPDGKTESVRWDDLQGVAILTTDEGPMAEDVYWILAGSNGGCAVSGGATGMKELLVRLQQLPGFDNEAVIKAMGSTINATFVCWKARVEVNK